MLFNLFNTEQVPCTVRIEEQASEIDLIFCDEKAPYSQDVLRIIKKAYTLHNMLRDYECSQRYYEREKEDLISAYSRFPLTQLDRADISEEKRIFLRNEKLKAEWTTEALLEKK